MIYPNWKRRIIGFAHPLHCWDVIANNNDNFLGNSQYSEDLSYIVNFCKKHGWDNYIDFYRLLNEGKSVVITERDTKIIWVSSSFEKMTGYTLAEVKGKRPSDVLQGENTSESLKQKIKKRLHDNRKLKAEIINYNKNGEQYSCMLDIYPVTNFQGEVVNYLAVEYKKEEG